MTVGCLSPFLHSTVITVTEKTRRSDFKVSTFFESIGWRKADIRSLRSAWAIQRQPFWKLVYHHIQLKSWWSRVLSNAESEEHFLIMNEWMPPNYLHHTCEKGVGQNRQEAQTGKGHSLWCQLLGSEQNDHEFKDSPGRKTMPLIHPPTPP